MKKLFSLLLVALMLLGSFSAMAEGEKAFNYGVIAENGTDKITYPWWNLNFEGSILFRGLFLAETDLATFKDDLAKADFEVSEDRLNYTFEILDGNFWSDGEPVTAKDVEFSIKTNLKAAVTNSIYLNAFKKIEGAEEWQAGAESLKGLSVDGNKIMVKLSVPYNGFVPTLSQFSILPEHALKDVDPLLLHNDKFWSNPITCGRYKVGEVNPGNYYTLVLNEYYKGQKPKIEKVIVHFISDNMIAIKSGQKDFHNTNDSSAIKEIEKLGYMSANPVDILYYRYFICNIKGVDGKENPAMQDVRVRQAILHAIDRQALAENLYPGVAEVINGALFDNNPLFSGLKFEYNPEKAKQLLAEANYDMNREFRILYYYSDQASVDFMEAIAYYLGEIGLKVALTNTSNGTQDLFDTREYDVGYKGLSAFDISEWFNEYNSTNPTFSKILGGDTIFDAAIKKLSEAVNADEKNEALKELQKIEQENLYKLPLFTFANTVFINTDHVKLPENIKFGNPWYRTDIDFDNWEIK